MYNKNNYKALACIVNLQKWKKLGNMLKGLLEKLGANTKVTVGVSITPNVGLEMIEIDNTTKMVVKYANRPLEYDYTNREVVNYDEFQECLEQLFDELKIPRRSNIILNLPTVHLGLISLPLMLEDEAVTNIILSEVEQSYIFKRIEPVVSWSDVQGNSTESRDLAFTAIQQTALEKITAACDAIGCNIAAVETSHASLVKALTYLNLNSEQIKDNVTWNLMIINPNSYAIIGFSGKRVVEYFEEPLALKSFEDDELYDAINTSLEITLLNLPANHLFIVSETDMVSAEVLAMKTKFEGQTTFLDCNKYAQRPLISTSLEVIPSLAPSISLSAVGIGIYKLNVFPFKFNIIKSSGFEVTEEEVDKAFPKIMLGSVEVEITPLFIKKMTIIAFSVLILPILALSLLFNFLTEKEKVKIDTITQEITQKNEELKKYTDANAQNIFNDQATIEKVAKTNRTNLFYYSAIGLNAPSKLWIDKFYASDVGVLIQGKSTNVENIYVFYKGLKQSITNSDVRLSKLQILSDSIEDTMSDSAPKVYEFEITNSSEEQLFPQAQNPNDPNAPAPDPNAPQSARPPEAAARPGLQLPFGPKQDTSAPPSGAPPKPGGLPANLEKIEKF